MIPAVIYARYSSSNQREESIAGQLRDCHAFAERNGFTIINEYTDSALTGRSDQRPAFQKMIADSDTHTFEAVIVWKLDRFARNRYDSAMYRNMLKKNGVKIYSAMENISDSPEGIILEGLMESLAEYYSANLAENVKRGLYDSALERKILGKPTFGYRRGSDGKYEIDPETAPIVQRIFKEYAAGKPYMSIVADLNRDGLKTINGNSYNKNSLWRILQNEKYIGVYRYKDIFDPEGIPPIIEKELFNKVQSEMKARSKTKVRADQKSDKSFILAGVLYCGECGQPMKGETATSATGRKYKYYSCVGTKNQTKNGCHKKRVKKEWIENEVLRMINDEILTPEFIDSLVQSALEYQKEEHENTRLTTLKKSIAKLDSKISNIISAIESGSYSEILNKHLSELEKERLQLSTELQKEAIKEPYYSEEKIRAFFDHLLNHERNASGTQRWIIRNCIKRIYLFDVPEDKHAQRITMDIRYIDGRNDPAPLDQIVLKIRSFPCLYQHMRTFDHESSVLLYSSMHDRI